jgi:shikimate kinase
MPPKNIVLIGFMGSGKSSIGRELSQILGYPLVDTDSLIVKRTGTSIPETFATEGEEAFRDHESAVLRNLVEEGKERQIIATGGGIIERSANRALLRQLGYVVWLIVSPAEILRRTSRNRDRPLLNNDDPEKTIRTLLNHRIPIYKEAAHEEIETETLTFPEIATGIIESGRYFFSHL